MLCMDLRGCLHLVYVHISSAYIHIHVLYVCIRSTTAEGAGKSKATPGTQERMETCEGRLPSEVARVLAPLIDRGVITLRGSVCRPPPPAAYSGKASMLFEDVGIHLEILLNRQAVGRALDRDLVRQLLLLVGAEEVREPVSVTFAGV